MAIDLSVNKGKLKLKNPILTASGTFGYNFEYGRFVDVASLGGIVTKAISLEPRSGNDWQRICETEGGMINSIGLENIGVKKFIEEKLPFLIKGNVNFIVNLAGASIDEYVKLAQICEENKINAVELNVSCPNVKSGCLEFGTDEKVLKSLVSQVRAVFSGCLIVKLTPNVTSVEKIALAAKEAGADAVSAILAIIISGEKGEAYNVSGTMDCNITLRNLAELIAKMANTNLRFEIPDEMEQAGYSKATKALLDIDKIRTRLNWVPKYSIEAGISRTISILQHLPEFKQKI